jgi:hypothetical protein
MGIFNSPNHIPLNYGIKTAGGLIGYFLLMRVVGLADNVELRLLNLLIETAGVYFALKYFKETHGSHLNYFRALITGVATSGIASGLFAVFLFIYMMADQSMLQFIIDNEPMGRYLNAYMVAFIVALEGGFAGLLVTFVLINYVHTDEVSES